MSVVSDTIVPVTQQADVVEQVDTIVMAAPPKAKRTYFDAFACSVDQDNALPAKRVSKKGLCDPPAALGPDFPEHLMLLEDLEDGMSFYGRALSQLVWTETLPDDDVLDAWLRDSERMLIMEDIIMVMAQKALGDKFLKTILIASEEEQRWSRFDASTPQATLFQHHLYVLASRIFHFTRDQTALLLNHAKSYNTRRGLMMPPCTRTQRALLVRTYGQEIVDGMSDVK